MYHLIILITFCITFPLDFKLLLPLTLIPWQSTYTLNMFQTRTAVQQPQLRAVVKLFVDVMGSTRIDLSLLMPQPE